MAEVCCYALIWLSYSVLLVVHVGALSGVETNAAIGRAAETQETGLLKDEPVGRAQMQP